jgi:predicted amidohydrolase YtcJ
MTPKAIFPDLLLQNGIIHTMDTHLPQAQAIAVRTGRIMAVGGNEEISDLADPSTQKIDLKGRLVLPGMMDSHFHFYDWAMGRKQLELAGEASLDHLLEKVAGATREKPAGSWILGQGWNESDWPEHIMPDRARLDRVAPNHPVALWRCDLHLVAVNSMALNLAGIDKNTQNPQDGIIEKDASGEPTGILRELAPNLIKAVIPDPGNQEIVSAMQDGISHLHSLGLTGIHDVRLMGGLEGASALKSWQLLNESGGLTLRCWVSLPGERLEEIVAIGLRTGMGDDRLRIGHLKYFADGGMGARTAWMIDPYLDAEYGMPLSSVGEIKRAVQKAEKAGLSVIIHAIGDRTNREIISLFEELAEKRKNSDPESYAPPLLPHRIEHTQMIRSEDIGRLASLGVAACVQPHNMILDINMIQAAVGPLGRHTYVYREMIDAGVPIMFSSDAPVCDPNPLVGIHAAVTRQRRDGTPEGGWYPDQRISVEQAVHAYTTVPAEFYGRSEELGSLSPGKRADMIVLDQNIFDVDPMQIHDTRVDMTIFDGKVVYHRNNSSE